MKTTTLDATAPPPLTLPLRRPARLRSVVEYLVSAAVACFGVYLLLD